MVVPFELGGDDRGEGGCGIAAVEGEGGALQDGPGDHAETTDMGEWQL